MKKLIFALLILTSCNVPIRIVETYTVDSTGKPVKTVQKYYNNTEVISRPSFEIYNSPLFYPYYRPILVPRIVQPPHRYTPRPVYPPRPNYTPRPPIKRH